MTPSVWNTPEWQAIEAEVRRHVPGAGPFEVTRMVYDLMEPLRAEVRRLRQVLHDDDAHDDAMAAIARVEALCDAREAARRGPIDLDALPLTTSDVRAALRGES